MKENQEDSDKDALEEIKDQFNEKLYGIISEKKKK